MSVETPKIEESAPIVTKPVEHTTIPAETSTPSTTEQKSTSAPLEPIHTAELVAPVETAPVKTTPVEAAPVETAQNEAVVTAVPATEGVLGYKGAPGLLK